jgi:hypothetical protein
MVFHTVYNGLVFWLLGGEAEWEPAAVHWLASAALLAAGAFVVRFPAARSGAPDDDPGRA